jgi:SAM-dependent methyltransferase
VSKPLTPQSSHPVEAEGTARGTAKEQAAEVARDWVDSPYYADAEQWTFIFWDEGGVFRKLFDRLDLEHVVELACGHGRHAEMMKGKAHRVTLMDILDSNVERARERHARSPNVVCIHNNGVDFRPLGDASATAIFCYDAMVHFAPAVVASYLVDACRILTPGGRALFHHSNYGVPFEHSYGMNPHARNFMTRELFTDLVQESGLVVEESETIAWGNVPELDGVTLLRKP